MSKSKRLATAIVLLLVFAISQVYVGVSFAGSFLSLESATTAPLQTTGILTTRGNKEITVNGANAISGATILSGATIETPAGVGATVNLGSGGSIEIEPGSKLTLEFQQGSIRATVIEGCVTMHTKKGTTGEIANSQGVSGRTDPDKDGKVQLCPRLGAAPVVAAAGAAGGLFGLGTAATVAIIGGGIAAVAVPVTLRGENPSP